MSAALVRIPTRCVARGPLPDAAGPGPKSLRAVNLAGASISVSLQSTAALAASQSPSTEELQGVDRDAWEASVEAVSSLGVDDAPRALRRAFGWSGRAYWRKERETPEVPTAARVREVVTYLETELGMSQDEVRSMVEEFPEVLGLSVEGRMKANVAQLESQWKMSIPVIKGVLLRRPEVLGYNIDCLGDCAGECNRCWVRF